MSPNFAVVNVKENVIHFVLAGNPTSEIFELEFLRALDGLIANEKSFLLVVDAQGVTGVSMSVAWSMIKWMRQNRNKLKLYLRGTGVVIQNEAVKAIMEFVLSMQPAVAPLEITSTTVDAWNFVKLF
jgi:hypothetical protein